MVYGRWLAIDSSICQPMSVENCSVNPDIQHVALGTAMLRLVARCWWLSNRIMEEMRFISSLEPGEWLWE